LKLPHVTLGVQLSEDVDLGVIQVEMRRHRYFLSAAERSGSAAARSAVRCNRLLDGVL
jgi:hypothetical protein